MAIKKIIRFLFVFSVILIMFLITIKAGLSYELDDIEDEYLLLVGQKNKGSFILEGLEDTLTIKTDFEWISFDKNGNISLVENTKGYQIYDDNFYVDYYINIPEDADIGIYRGVIEINDGEEIKYLNIKLNIQNKFFYLLFEQLKNPSKFIYMIIFIFLIIIVFISLKYFLG